MLALGGRLDAVRLHSVRLRGATDGLLARQRLEAALSDVASSTLCLPPQSLLIVRRVAPAEPLQLSSTVSARKFTQTVRADLQRIVRGARLPILDATATAADAVLFADETELVVCLARDWLHGCVADRWWWPSVLGNLSPQEWLRRHVLGRGELIVPATAILADSGAATAWLARFEDTEAEEAIAVIARTYALSLTFAPSEPVAQPRARSDLRSPAVIGIDRRVSTRTAAFERLIAAVPEALTPELRPPQRRLAAVALALAREPSWARTPQLALALRELDRVTPLALAQLWAIPEAPRTEPARRLDEGAAALPEVSSLADRTVRSIEWPHATRSIGVHAPHLDPPRAIAQRRENVASISEQHKPPAFVAAVVREVPATPSDDARTPPAKPVPGEVAAVEQAARVRTQFGGIFYLLNAALAMRLYGDFTAPRARGLALSPWDWLALVGRAWFGRAFVRDPVWRLLAGLAGRQRRSLRRPRWLRAQIESLLARLALALGEERSAGIPALVCRYPGEVAVSATRVDVHLALSDLPLAIRVAGLDRDPGWIPAAGRAIAFHFE